MLLRPRAVPAYFILLSKVTWLKEKPNASPSGSEKKKWRERSSVGAENLKYDATLKCQLVFQCGGIGALCGFGELGHPFHSLWVLLKFPTVLQSKGSPKLGTPSEQGRIFQCCSPMLLWQCKAWIDGSTSNFI